MAQQVPKDQASALEATLVDGMGSPVTGQTNADVTVEYQKEGETTFTALDLTDQPATVVTTLSEPYLFSAGLTLDVVVDGGVTQIITIDTSGFTSNISFIAASAIEVAAELTANLTGATATAINGSVSISSTSTGPTASVQITGGTSNTLLGFPTNVENGYIPWVEVGSGEYTITFSASALDTSGDFIFTVNGGAIEQFVGVAEILGGIAVDACLVTGTVRDLNGDVIPSASVYARIVSFPSIYNNEAITDSSVAVLTDSNGDFSLPLIQGTLVDITIGKANYRRQITVPAQSTINLFEIP